MSDIAIEVERQVADLAALLARDGLNEQALNIKNIHQRRLFWDGMALRLSKYLGTLLLQNGLAEDSKRVALNLQEALKPFTVSPHEELVYTPARQLGADIEKAGFSGWERLIADEIAGGCTSGEIFDGLRFQLNKFLKKTPNAPADLHDKIRSFLSRLR